MDLDLLEVSEVDLTDKDDDVVLKIVVERAWKRNLEWKDYNPKWLVLASLFPYPGFSIPSNPTCKDQRSKILI